MATDLDILVTACRTRPPRKSEPFTVATADDLTIRVCDRGLVVNAVVLVATGVNAGGHRASQSDHIVEGQYVAENLLFVVTPLLLARARGGQDRDEPIHGWILRPSSPN